MSSAARNLEIAHRKPSADRTLEVIPDPAQWAINIGAIGGAIITALYSRRAASNSQSVKQQTGSDLEPSLRTLITDSQRSLKEHREEMSAMFRGLHGDVEDLGNRMKRIETGYTGMDTRLKRVEDMSRESQVLTIAVATMGKLVASLVGTMDRAQANIHKIANAVQVTLINPEDIEKPPQQP